MRIDDQLHVKGEREMSRGIHGDGRLLAQECVWRSNILQPKKQTWVILFLWCVLDSMCSVWAQSLSGVWLFVTPWTAARQAPPSMEFSRQDTGVGCHFLLQGIIPNQGLNLGVLCLLYCRWILYPLSHRGRSPHPAPLQIAYEVWFWSNLFLKQFKTVTFFVE